MTEVRVRDTVEIDYGSTVYRGIITSVGGSTVRLNITHKKHFRTGEWVDFTATDILWDTHRVRVTTPRKKGFGKWISQR